MSKCKDMYKRKQSRLRKDLSYYSGIFNLKFFIMATASFLSLFTHVRHNELIKRHKHNSLKPDRKQTSKEEK